MEDKQTSPPRKMSEYRKDYYSRTAEKQGYVDPAFTHYVSNAVASTFFIEKPISRFNKFTILSIHIMLLLGIAYGIRGVYLTEAALNHQIVQTDLQQAYSNNIASMLKFDAINKLLNTTDLSNLSIVEYGGEKGFAIDHEQAERDSARFDDINIDDSSVTFDFPNLALNGHVENSKVKLKSEHYDYQLNSHRSILDVTLTRPFDNSVSSDLGMDLVDIDSKISIRSINYLDLSLSDPCVFRKHDSLGFDPQDCAPRVNNAFEPQLSVSANEGYIQLVGYSNPVKVFSSNVNVDIFSGEHSSFTLDDKNLAQFGQTDGTPSRRNLYSISDQTYRGIFLVGSSNLFINKDYKVHDASLYLRNMDGFADQAISPATQLSEQYEHYKFMNYKRSKYSPHVDNHLSSKIAKPSNGSHVTVFGSYRNIVLDYMFGNFHINLIPNGQFAQLNDEVYAGLLAIYGETQLSIERQYYDVVRKYWAEHIRPKSRNLFIRNSTLENCRAISEMKSAVNNIYFVEGAQDCGFGTYITAEEFDELANGIWGNNI